MPCWSHAELNVFAKQTLRTGKGLPTWMLKLETASCTATYHLTRPDGMDLSRRSASSPRLHVLSQFHAHIPSSRRHGIAVAGDVYHRHARLPCSECGCGLDLLPEESEYGAKSSCARASCIA